MYFTSILTTTSWTVFRAPEDVVGNRMTISLYMCTRAGINVSDFLSVCNTRSSAYVTWIHTRKRTYIRLNCQVLNAADHGEQKEPEFRSRLAVKWIVWSLLMSKTLARIYFLQLLPAVTFWFASTQHDARHVEPDIQGMSNLDCVRRLCEYLLYACMYVCRCIHAPRYVCIRARMRASVYLRIHKTVEILEINETLAQWKRERLTKNSMRISLTKYSDRILHQRPHASIEPEAYRLPLLHIYTCIRTCTRVYVHVHVYTCKRTCTWTRIYINIDICIFAVVPQNTTTTQKGEIMCLYSDYKDEENPHSD